MYRLVVPVVGQAPLPWGFFMVQAARGAPDVPDFVFRALPMAVAERCNLHVEDVDEDHLAECLDRMPGSPQPVIDLLGGAMGLRVPGPGARLRLESEALMAPWGATVSQEDLLHDALVRVGELFGPAPFHKALERIEDPAAWNRLDAVVAMIYILAIRIY
jgi:hypothetical protein